MDTPERLADRLRQSGERSLEFFKAIPADQWNRQIYSEGENWDLRQVLAHLVQAESGMIRLVESILEGGAGTPEGFDLDAYNQRKLGEVSDQSPEQLLEKFAVYRQKTAEMVARLDEGNLLKPGRHPFLGLTTVGEIIKMIYRHSQIHQREVRKLLKG